MLGSWRGFKKGLGLWRETFVAATVERTSILSQVREDEEEDGGEEKEGQEQKQQQQQQQEEEEGEAGGLEITQAAARKILQPREPRNAERKATAQRYTGQKRR